MSNLKHKLYEIIFEHDTPSGKAFDVVLIIFVALSVFSVMLETVAPLYAVYKVEFLLLEYIFTILFTIELALRLYCAPHKFKYLFSFYGLIDLLAILPTYLSVLIPGAQAFLIIRTMRLLRIFRILKLTNYTTAGSRLLQAVKGSKPKIIVFVFFVVTLVTIVGTMMFYIEGRENGFTSIPKAIYWAIVTMTTVGYGDITPSTSLGQAMSAILMIVGYGVIAVPTGIISTEMAKIERLEEEGCAVCKDPNSRPVTNYCHNCGKRLKA